MILSLKIPHFGITNKNIRLGFVFMFSIVIIFKGGLNTYRFCGVLNGIFWQCSCWPLTKHREAAYRTFFKEVLPEMLAEKDDIKGFLCLYIVFKEEENYFIERNSTRDYYVLCYYY